MLSILTLLPDNYAGQVSLHIVICHIEINPIVPIGNTTGHVQVVLLSSTLDLWTRGGIRKKELVSRQAINSIARSTQPVYLALQHRAGFLWAPSRPPK